MIELLRRRWMLWITVVFALFYIGLGTLTQGVGEFDSVGERVFWGVTGVAIGIVILMGLAQCRLRPKLGGTMVVIGGLVGGFVTFWLVVTPIVGLMVAVYGVIRAREFADVLRHEHVLKRGRGTRV